MRSITVSDISSFSLAPQAISISEMAVRMLLACGFGFIIGIDREMHSRPAGLRTNMLTALAACVFAIIAFEMIASLETSNDGVRLDPIRVVEAVTAGVAFLAAGTIIQARGDVRGLTTGAGMWLAGAIGLACGSGLNDKVPRLRGLNKGLST